jgi:hypothetical protein
MYADTRLPEYFLMPNFQHKYLIVNISNARYCPIWTMGKTKIIIAKNENENKEKIMNINDRLFVP